VISPGLAGTAVALLLLHVLFLALIDVAFAYFSNISIRTYREEIWKTEQLTQAIEDPMSFLLPMRIGLQGSFIAITVLVTMLYMFSEVSQPLVMAFLTMLVVFLVFGEAVPNIIARKNPERVLLALMPAYRFYGKLVTPISRPLAQLVGVFVKNGTRREEAVTDEVVQAYIEVGEGEGILEGDEGKMVQSIVALDEKVAREIMTPRPEVVAIRAIATMGELRMLFEEEKYSRVPVFRESLDHIEGLVYAIDLVGTLGAEAEASFESLLRPVSFIPESKNVAELLKEFQHSKQTLAIVVDEYGGTSGLVTVEDILEEIVGEIYDEFDEVDEEIIKEAEGVFLVSGRADIDEVQKKIQFSLTEGSFETVSGYVLHAIGRIPTSGEVLDHRGIRIEVVDADGQRIKKVRLRLPT
jgi:putative hemolysin